MMINITPTGKAVKKIRNQPGRQTQKHLEHLGHSYDLFRGYTHAHQVSNATNYPS